MFPRNVINQRFCHFNNINVMQLKTYQKYISVVPLTSASKIIKL